MTIKHGPFYESILIDNLKYDSRCNVLAQLIRQLATIILKYFKCGLVHGNISSENIELKIDQPDEHHDVITDVRIINYDFSYPYGVN